MSESDEMSKLKKLVEYKIDGESLPPLPQPGDRSKEAINSLYANIRALPEESGSKYNELLNLFISSL